MPTRVLREHGVTTAQNYVIATILLPVSTSPGDANVHRDILETSAKKSAHLASMV